MTITITNGEFTNNNRIQAGSNKTWATIGTTIGSWGAWTQWNTTPKTLTVEIQEDAESIDSRLCRLPLISQGELTVTLAISDTTDSAGVLVSPTTTTLVLDTAFSPVAGRHYRYTLVLATDSAGTAPIMAVPDIQFDTSRDTEFLEKINTSTLAGAIDARVIVTSIGTVTGLVITAQEAGVTYGSGLFQDRQYVMPDNYVRQENAIVTNVVSKANKTIRSFDLNGESIDCVLDCVVQGLAQITLTSTGVL